MKKLGSMLVLASAALILAACAESTPTDTQGSDPSVSSESPTPVDSSSPDETSQDPTPVDPTTITLDVSEVTLKKGESHTFTASVSPATVTYTWSLSDPSVIGTYVDATTTAEGGYYVEVLDLDESAPATLTVTCTTSDGVSASATITLAYEEEPTYDNIYWADGTFGFAGQTDCKAGQVVYWAGDGGSVSSSVVEETTYSLAYSSTSNWYGVQIFGALPYATEGDSYRVSLSLTSDVAGDITVNGEVVTLEASTPKEVTYDVSGTSSYINIQLGTNGGSPLAGATFAMTVNYVYDTTPNDYYGVTFTSEETTLKDIPVRKGSTVTAPADPSKEGYVFTGWQDGETKWNSTLTIDKEYNFVAQFTEASQVSNYKVTYVNALTNAEQSEEVVAGNIVKADLDYDFGYAAGKFYSDSALTTEIEIATYTPTADATVYYVPYLTPSTWINSQDAGWSIASSYYSNDPATGAWVLKDYNGWSSGTWAVQVNFTPVSQYCNDANKTYTISVDYNITATGGDVQVYDGATYGSVASLSNASGKQTAAITFDGAVAGTGDNKLTFELGAITETTFTLSIYSISITSVEKSSGSDSGSGSGDSGSTDEGHNFGEITLSDATFYNDYYAKFTPSVAVSSLMDTSYFTYIKVDGAQQWSLVDGTMFQVNVGKYTDYSSSNPHTYSFEWYDTTGTAYATASYTYQGA